MFNELSLFKRNEKCLGKIQYLLCPTCGTWLIVEGQYLLVMLAVNFFLLCNMFPHMGGYFVCLVPEDK